MVTKQDLENVLAQVNTILKRMDDRLTKLEEEAKKPQATQKKAPIAKAS